MQRATIAETLTLSGTGLHRGADVTVRLAPSEGGIVFVREGVCIPATPEHIVDTTLNTTLGRDGVTIATVEHLMAALWGMGITDCTITVTGDEMPAMDGSALPFVERIQQTGVRALGHEIAALAPNELLHISEGDSWVEAAPGPFGITYSIDFPDRAIGRQAFTYRGESFAGQIAPARTFGRLQDVERMRALGLAQGGGLHNAVIVDGERILNAEGLRFADEFIRHKVLDLLGDLWTVGVPLACSVCAHKASHRLHAALARRLYALRED